MKRLGTMIVVIVALGLLAASTALAAAPNPWKTISVQTNANWSTGKPSDVRTPSDVRKPSDVRTPSRVRQGIRTWTVRPTADWSSRASARSWSDGS